jgi:hypothetical protein
MIIDVEKFEGNQEQWDALVEQNRIKWIARVCHQANKAYCESEADFSQVDWESAPEWQTESAMNGVKFRLENSDAPASGMHDNWSKEKLADGWVYGETKDAEKKTHPCLVPFEELPLFQQKKDKLFSAIVDALK